MGDASFFSCPKNEWQRRYEALRASFVEGLPAQVVADRFGYASAGYIHLLRHLFRSGQLEFDDAILEGKSKRRKITADLRKRIRSCRERGLSAAEIAAALKDEAVVISVRTIERVLIEEGYPRLKRRKNSRIGVVLRGTEMPQRIEPIRIGQLNGKAFASASAGIFLFAPFLAQLGADELIRQAKLPATGGLPANGYLLALLALKLLGPDREAHCDQRSVDQALGLFAGLNAIPRRHQISAFAAALDPGQLRRLNELFFRSAAGLGLHSGKIIDLDLHRGPHFGGPSSLARAEGGPRRGTDALTLFARDGESGIMVYADTGVRRRESGDRLADFLSFWKTLGREHAPTLVFDCKFTGYRTLAELEAQGIPFITLRRRGRGLFESVSALRPWQPILLPGASRKFRRPLVHDGKTALRGYPGQIRQIVLRDHGPQQPTFILTNDLQTPAALVVAHCARHWRAEPDDLAEAVKFFHFTAAEPPMNIPAELDAVLTLIADALYRMLARALPGGESYDVPRVYRRLIRGEGRIALEDDTVRVTLPRKAYSSVLRRVPWSGLPAALPGLKGARLELRFEQ